MKLRRNRHLVTSLKRNLYFFFETLNLKKLNLNSEDFSKPNINKALDVFKKRGTVVSLGDGIAVATGLHQVKFGEVVEISFKKKSKKGNTANNIYKTKTIKGLALDLRKSLVKIALLGNDNRVVTGAQVSCTGNLAGLFVGEHLKGRVIDSLGEPLDLLEDFALSDSNKVWMDLEQRAPGIVERQKISESLDTGIKIVDSMIPIGRGQRELIIGDRQLGKTAIALDAISNQKFINATTEKKKNVFCVYVAVGQKRSAIAKIVKKLETLGCLNYTVIVSATASDPASMQYLAPYTGCAIGEWLRDSGFHSLLVYDDLSKHAVAYRQMSLLLRRPPGREAYPGDVFYLHSRLLERSAKLNSFLGGGTLTALPVIETQAGDVSTYIPTNVISITDGQIFLDKEIFFKGLKPAINVGLSVSRIGSSSQVPNMKKYAGRLKLDLAQFNDVEYYATFGSDDLDETTRQWIVRGLRLLELLKQYQFSTISIKTQIFLVYASVHGYLDKLQVKEIKPFERIVSLSLLLGKNKNALNAIDNEKHTLNHELLSKFFDTIHSKFFDQ